MHVSLWPDLLVNFPTRLDSDVQLSGWDKTDGNDSDGSYGRMSCEAVADKDVLDDKGADSPGDSAYADALEFHAVCSGQRAANIFEFAFGVGLPERRLSDDISENFSGKCF